MSALSVCGCDNGDQYALTRLTPRLRGLQPELVAIVQVDRRPQDIPATVRHYAEGDVDCPYCHHALIADLHPDRVEEHHRIQLLQRPGQRSATSATTGLVTVLI